MSEKSPEVDAYIESAPQERQEDLAALRDLIHAALPDVKETIQYKMPTFSYEEMVCGFSSRKNYISLYCKPEVVDLYRDELGKLNVGKGCIRFRSLEQVPLTTVREILARSVD